MYVRCWGSRGSIPVCGAEYQRYGGDTTCLEVRAASGELVVVDAGSGIRRLGEKLAKEGAKRFTVLFTHAHIDHILGVPFFAPIYQKDTRIQIYGRPYSVPSYREIIKGIMSAPYCPVELETVEAGLEFATVGDQPLRIGSLTITSIPISHPNGGLGYRFEENGKSFVFLTDNELDYRHPGGRGPDDYAAFASGADLLIHDAEYTAADYSRAWGHSLMESAVKLGMKAKAKRFGLFHINQKRTDDEMDGMVGRARELVRSAGRPMECFGVGNTWETRLE
jgi:phosphoribosyl 1,2-cyclic phosphodiesterase